MVTTVQQNVTGKPSARGEEQGGSVEYPGNSTDKPLQWLSCDREQRCHGSYRGRGPRKQPLEWRAFVLAVTLLLAASCGNSNSNWIKQ